MKISFNNFKRAWVCVMYRVSQRDGARVSAASAGADSDGTLHIPTE